MGERGGSSVPRVCVPLKSALAAAQALLQPPSPLPSSPPDLLARLRLSSSRLPVVWRQSQRGWGDDTEVGHVGDDEEGPQRKARRDELLMVVGWRALALLREMQTWLEKEFWPPELCGGLVPQDYLLGTNDLRLVRLLLSHTIASLLLPLTLDYVASVRSGSVANEDLRTVLHSLLDLLKPPQLPPQASGPSKHSLLPYTTITQTLVSSHLPPIVLSVISLAYTPTVPPPVNAALRADLLGHLQNLSPAQALAALGGAMKLMQTGKKGQEKGWVRQWPGYVGNAVAGMMSAQVRRPGGVKAVIVNVFGEESNRESAMAVDEQRLEHVAKVLSRIPQNVPLDAYLPALLSSLFDLITPAESDDNSAPRTYVHAASYTAQKLWSQYPRVVRPSLERRLHELWRPDISTQVREEAERGNDTILIEASDVTRNLRTLYNLSIYAPPTPQWSNFLIRPILTPLFALYTACNNERVPAGSAAPDIIESKDREVAPSALEKVVLSLITTWVRVVDKDDAVRGLWAIVQSEGEWFATPAANDQAGSLQWEVKGALARLVCISRNEVQIPSMGSLDVIGDLSVSLEQMRLQPDPTIFVRLLKDSERPDIISELFLKMLQEWRVRSASAQRNPSLLLYVQLVLLMIEELGQKLLAQPEHVLRFIEGVLADEAQALNENKDAPLIIEEVNQKPSEGHTDLSEGDIEKMGIVETAIQLLLVINQDSNLETDYSQLLFPIRAHLGVIAAKANSTDLRRLANDSLLRVAASNWSPEPSTSETTPPAILTYRRALSLISDPLPPVHAHGLSLLRDLVISSDFDLALAPSIMDVFLKAIQDSESYIYLNAAKGLAGMVDVLGKEVLTGLVREYRAGAELASKDGEGGIDKVLRIGEALNMVICRSARGLSVYAETVVPVLASTFPCTRLPTVIRTSSLSLLSTCAEADCLALLPWSSDLLSGVIDLVQIESVVSVTTRPPRATPAVAKATRKVVLVDDEGPDEEPLCEEEAPPPTVDSEPIKAGDSKHPSLRRAALVFLGLLFASLIEARMNEDEKNEKDQEIRLHVETSPKRTSPQVGFEAVARAEAILGYVAQTDVDEMTRMHAAEVVVLLQRWVATLIPQSGIRIP